MKEVAATALGFWDRSPMVWLAFFVMAAALAAFVVFLIVAAVKILRPKVIPTPWGSAKFNEEHEEEPTGAPDDAIMHHRLFRLIEQALVPGGLSLKERGDKTVIAETYLRIKFAELDQGFRDFFEESSRRGFKGLSKLPHEVAEMVIRYETKAAKAEYHCSDGIICRLPSCFSRKFAKWHQRHADQLFTDYHAILSDRALRDNRERAWLMADATFYALRETIFDARQTMLELNGDLDEEIARLLYEKSCEDV